MELLLDELEVLLEELLEELDDDELLLDVELLEELEDELLEELVLDDVLLLELEEVVPPVELLLDDELVLDVLVFALPATPIPLSPPQADNTKTKKAVAKLREDI
ncbi:hypothetical protein P886_0753 [Alteromonadaceae bacterium 2753L.S.0a.02]|nr:hypothetical protein P886_0753 [Alteromonadaceae bacterium 2753L.S.0a.02]